MATASSEAVRDRSSRRAWWPFLVAMKASCASCRVTSASRPAPARYAPAPTRGNHGGAMATAFVRLLGAVQFVDEHGEVVDLPSATQRKLLAALALASGAT